MRFDGGTLQDIRYCSRMLASRPGFTALAVLMLAAGIGANAAVFSLSNELFLRTAPAVTDPGRLVALGRSSGGESFDGFGHLTYLKYREQAQSFTGLVASRGARLLWREGQETVVLEGRLVSANYFSLLGVRIAPGRDFLPEEDRTPGTYPVAIVSHDVWKNRFGSNPALIDRAVRLNDTEFTVVGIAPEGFRGLEVGDGVDVWLPLMMEAQARPPFPQLNSDFFHTLGVVGRLRPGVSRQQAEAELTVLASRIETPDGKLKQPRRVVLTPHIRLPDPGWRAEAASAVALLSAVTALVLLIVCMNLACLLLARSVARRKEIAVRLAVGASRGRVIRQLLSESVVLAAMGALGGLFVSHWIAALLRARIDQNLDFSIDRTVLLVAALLAVLAAVLFGLAPAFHATRRDLAADLKDQRTTTQRTSRLRNALVAGQVAVSLVLLSGAGLFVRTFQKASAVDVGFETQHLFLVGPDLELAGYSDERAREFYRQLTERIAVLPGVQAVSCANALPRYGDMFWGAREIVLEGREAGASDARVQVEYNEIAPRYFETLGVGLVGGRGLTAQDDRRAPRGAVVNETMARQLWPAGDPLGKRLRLVEFMGMSAPFEIVGIVRDSRTLILDDRVPPEIYVPLELGRRRNSTVLIRAANGSAGVAAAISQQVHQLDPSLPRVQVKTMAERMAQGLSDQRMYAEFTGLFSALALLLAAIGLYGTMAFAVSQRTRDIGVRMALGARRGDVLWMVIREGLMVTAYGVAVGLLGSFVLTRLVASHLYGVTPTDPVSFATSTLVLVATAFLACWVPARHAARLDPLTALRYE